MILKATIGFQIEFRPTKAACSLPLALSPGTEGSCPCSNTVSNNNKISNIW